jgi:hypothetical protein
MTSMPDYVPVPRASLGPTLKEWRIDSRMVKSVAFVNTSTAPGTLLQNGRPPLIRCPAVI